MRKALAVSTVVLLVAPLHAQTPAAPVVRQLVPVADETRELQGDSLVFKPALNGRGGRREGGGGGPERGGRGGRDRGGPNLMDAKEDDPQGLQEYLFVLRPGERIRFSLNGVLLGRMRFQLAMPELQDQDPLFGELQKVNQLPIRLRQTGIAFRNTLDRPYRLVLALVGRTGLSYRIAIQRDIP